MISYNPGNLIASCPVPNGSVAISDRPTSSPKHESTSGGAWGQTSSPHSFRKYVNLTVIVTDGQFVPRRA